MRTKRFIFISLGVVCLVLVPLACKKRDYKSEMVADKSSQPAKAGKWIVKYRPADTTKAGSYAALYSFNAISIVSPSLIYVVANYPDPLETDNRIPILIKSVDGGENWTEKRIATGDKKITRLNAVRFETADSGWAAGADEEGHGFVLRTSDGGANWSVTPISATLTPTSIYGDQSGLWLAGVAPRPPAAPAIIPNSPNAGQSAKAVKSATAKPRPASTSKPGKSSKSDDDDETSDDGPSDLLFSSDQGSNWISRYRLPVSINDFCFLDSNTAWAVGNPASVYHTSDAGRTWDSQDTGIASGFGTHRPQIGLSGVSFCDPMHGWIAGSSEIPATGVVESTSDGGKTWNLLWNADGETFEDILFVTPKEGWVVSVNGRYVFHSGDAGRTWQVESIEYDQRPPLYRLAALDPSHVWAVGGGGIFFRQAP